jgi:hypothetical protein
LNEEDAPQDTTTGDAAGVPPQEAGGPHHAQGVHRDRCTQPLLEHKRGEATIAVVRPEDVPTELIDQKRDGDLETPNAKQHPLQESAERSGQLQPERSDPATPPEKPPSEPAERSGKQLDDDLQLPAAETTPEKHPRRQGKLALSAALPSEQGSVPGPLRKVEAVTSTRSHQADHRHQRRLLLPQQDPAVQQRQPRPAGPAAHHNQKHRVPPQLWRSPQPQHDTDQQIRQRRPPEPGVRQAPEHEVVFRISYAYLVETEDGRSKPLRRSPKAG